MKPHQAPSHLEFNHRRIGRRVLQADRLHHALKSAPKKTRKQFVPLFLKDKRVVAIGVSAILVLSIISVTGSRMYASAHAESQRAQAVVAAKKAKQKSDAADACHRKKAAEKADQLGKITYAQLYENDCGE